MEFSKDFKSWWYLLVFVLLTVLLGGRWGHLQNGKAEPLDLILVAGFAALLFLPLVSEVTFAGVTLKQRVDDLKRELREQLVSLRSELVNLNVNQSSVSVTNNPPVDLNGLKTEILDEIRREIGTPTVTTNGPDMAPPESAQRAFSFRYQLEREIRRLWTSRREVGGQQPVPRMIRDLVTWRVLPASLEDHLMMVWRISSQAVHGNAPDQEQLAFMTDVVPPIVASLREIQ